MVRQDKITYLVTFFQNEKNELSEDISIDQSLDYSFKNDINLQIIEIDYFPGNVINNRVLSRLGVISTSDIEETQTLMSEFIPFNKHDLLFVNIQKIGNEICTAFVPLCLNCSLREICDYYNEKNHWA